MHIIIIALMTAIGYYILLRKFLGVKLLIKYERWIDAIFSIGIPFFFIGTFSGMATAVIAGVMLSIMIALLKWMVGERV